MPLSTVSSDAETPASLADHRRVHFLASVRSVAEARVVAAAGAGIVDAKEPDHGALGAVALTTITRMRETLPAWIPLSATIGDVPCDDTERILAAVAATDAAGADLVKIGLFPPAEKRAERDAHALLSALATAPAAFGRRVLVMLADTPLDLALLASLPSAGFTAVMLDTADKSSGALTDVLDTDAIARFVFTARQARLRVGLAGALRLWHIPSLMRLEPDILGFRGALCRGGTRTSEIDFDAATEVAIAIGRSAAAAAA